MDRLPRVTVVIPCFNLGQFVDEAVASVFAQTYHTRFVRRPRRQAPHVVRTSPPRSVLRREWTFGDVCRRIDRLELEVTTLPNRR
jgi:GT2 family glycosyltransferase